MSEQDHNSLLNNRISMCGRQRRTNSSWVSSTRGNSYNIRDYHSDESPGEINTVYAYLKSMAPDFQTPRSNVRCGRLQPNLRNIGNIDIDDDQSLKKFDNNVNYKNFLSSENSGSRSNDFNATKMLLQEMLIDDYDGNIALKLLDPVAQVKNFFNNTDRHDSELVKLVIRVVLKASENKWMESNFREFLILLIDSNFIYKTLDKVISIDLQKEFDIEIFKLLILFLKLLFEILPSKANEALYARVQNILMLAEFTQLRSNILTMEILNEVDDLKILATSSCSYVQAESKRYRKAYKFDDKTEPPDNFREITIFPSSQDLNIDENDVFIRRNQDRGVFKSVDDYLDVQFRLMREDFIHPLREGLKQLKQQSSAHKRLDIRVYKKVFIRNSLPADRNGIIYNLDFTQSYLRRVNWLQSKRLIYGSLLCLSNDNFETLLFATVANREIKELERGFVPVKIFESSVDKSKDYVMVETINMFESYRHVLVKLQETNAENLCFQKYLVFADGNITLPGYLARNNGLEYNFLDKTFFPGINNSKWPRAVEFDFDESQYEAFKTALTKELAIIQGPPGTGKTYLGLKICHCLLENVQKQLHNFGPILIVCYTNHALDQFLEGIHEFTKNIVRIGSRSKSEILQNYSLFNLKKRLHFEKSSINKEIVYEKMKEIKQELLMLQASIKASRDSLINISTCNMISDEHKHYLKEVGIKNWLSGDMIYEHEKSNVESTLDNMIEWIIYKELASNMRNVIIEAQVELATGVEDYQEDQDVEVVFLNNQRQLDTDDNIRDLNLKFEKMVAEMRTVNFDEDVLPVGNDGFIQVRSKLVKQLFQKRLRSNNTMTQEEAISVISLNYLEIKTRWRLYHYWRSRYVESLDERSKKLELEFDYLSKQLNEIIFEEDRQIMMTRDIIGMTTTGAARYGRVLSQIQCKIIIVEEAAEVLESHIVGSLNKGCEHLVLIGDHKQLRPSSAVYKLAQIYHLDLSLFERLINNNLHYSTLELQHRMRPEIAEIMKFIYENLKNHDSVNAYPNVAAVSVNLFFFDHSELESHNEEISSYSNAFEAKLVVNFTNHLMKNGIESSKITILTLYSGQLFLLRKMMPKETFKDLRVCVVDNYQGEENDIILLSLVRSNLEDRIGFLSIENRICVSLSRAKIGFYVFGNFDILTRTSELWKKICLDLRRKDRLGNTLILLCQNHPEKRLEVKHPDDFNKYPEGGCTQLCNQRLECGHACRKSCHFLDKNHLNVKCIEVCTKLCPNGHRCNLKCWQECGNCLVMVDKIVPGCNHVQKMECFKRPIPSYCLNKCDRLLKCNHKCLRKCNEKCSDCLQKVIKVSEECGHKGEYLCSDKLMICTKKCDTELDCEHLCVGTCGECNCGRLHVTCGNKCIAQLICGHACQGKCSDECSPCIANCNEGCFHNICPKNCGDECVPCYENCKWICKHKKCNKKCFEFCDRDICNERCSKSAKCIRCSKLFQCYGVCGEQCRKICLKCDPGVKEVFFGTEDSEEAMFITLWTCEHSLERESMDRFMALVPDNGEVLPKRCPKCNTIINKRSCFRYLNIVRKIYVDIKNVQKLMYKDGLTTSLSIFKKEYSAYSKIIPLFYYQYNTILQVYNCFSKLNRNREQLSNYEVSKYATSLNFLQNINDVLHLRFKILDKTLDIDYQYIKNSITQLIKWLDPEQRKFSNFEIRQFNSEFDRIDFILKATELKKKTTHVKELSMFISELKMCKDFSGQFANDFREKWNKVTNCLPSIEITENKPKEIVSAIGLSKGHWFKCPNDHYYCIDQCGGANQIAKCGECDANIGCQ